MSRLASAWHNLLYVRDAWVITDDGLEACLLAACPSALQKLPLLPCTVVVAQYAQQVQAQRLTHMSVLVCVGTRHSATVSRYPSIEGMNHTVACEHVCCQLCSHMHAQMAGDRSTA